MLRGAERLREFHLHARDGNIGYVDDLLFDDERWNVRYLVVDTGEWLPGRKVLLIPGVLGAANDDDKRLDAALTRDQVKNSPDIDTAKPVSRQKEVDLFAYYGWSPYWGGGHGGFTRPVMRSISPEKQELSGAEPPGDPHLRSLRAVKRYSIHAEDGGIGHVEDLIVDDNDWVVRYLVIDTRNWLPGRKVVIPPDRVGRIDWQQRSVTVGLTKDQIRNSPEYDEKVPIEREFEVRLYNHFGWPGYWE